MKVILGTIWVSNMGIYYIQINWYIVYIFRV